MPDETMIERVARVMWERTHDGDWERDSEAGTIEIYRQDARAAIEALAEPTEALLECAVKGDFMGWSYGGYTQETKEAEWMRMRRVEIDDFGRRWRAMIAAALAEPRAETEERGP